MNAELLLEHYVRIAEAPDAIARLRRFVLDLAVRGKLVEQDPNDEPAAELLKRIAADRARLVKEGAAQKGKDLPPASDDIEFDIPQSWTWARLGSITSYIQRGKSPKYAEADGVPVVSQKCVQWSGLNLDVARLITRQSLENYEKVRFLQVGDLLWNSTGTGTIGRVIRLENVPVNLVCDSHVTVVRCLVVKPEYIRTWLRSDYVYGVIEDRAAGSTNQVELTAQMAINQVVPLPPLAEQHRIVAKVDELMALCDQLETAQAEREGQRDKLTLSTLVKLNEPDPETFAADARFALKHLEPLTKCTDQIKQLRQTILNLAVRGEFTSDKNLRDGAPDSSPSVQNTPKPYQIPSYWRWVRMDEGVRFIGGSQPPKSTFIYEPREGYTRLIQIRDFKSDKYATYVPSDKANRPFSETDVMIGRYGPPVFQILRGLSGTYNVALMKAVPINGCISSDFLYYLLQESRIHDEVVKESERTAGQTGVRLPLLNSFVIAVPPLAEQHRIVAKVNELMTLCDQLEASLIIGEQTRSKLLEAVLHEALEPA